MHLTIKVNVPTYYRGSNYGTNIYTFDCDFNSTIDTCSGTAVSGSSSWSIVIQK
jgi:hypothetical protein